MLSGEGAHDQQNFNPRSPHGERPRAEATNVLQDTFQSTLPAWGATNGSRPFLPLPFISIHAPRMGSDRQQQKQFNANYISIHAPRMGSDLIMEGEPRARHISIHAPRMGSDSTAKAYSNDRIKWSTLREPHFFYSKNACFSPIVSMCATTSRTKKSENQSFIRIISRLGPYVFHLRLVSIPQIIEPYAVRLLVHQHFQCGTK